ncbi:hypothetical protein Pan241w_47310 [Gimesia alba]|uniref:Uncharacterized protein n=1 Tax=Gimesia alba TaxID=2527973 RepID=A0A517RL80_9PLAN|nr:hypothetical protein Pan241w_47310 [Gimesia alba]
MRQPLVIPVIIVTQYETFGDSDDKKTLEQLKAELKHDFPSVYRDAVYYHPAQSDWKTALTKVIEKLIT